MKNKVLIFGGTTEGRELADILRVAKVPHTVSVATEYGESIELQSGESDVLVGRKNADEIAALIDKEGYGIVVDATHPYAVRASEEIKNACDESGAIYLRLSRDTGADFCAQDDVYVVNSLSEAADMLNKIQGNILVLTGSRDLAELMGKINDKGRVFARVLPNTESLKKCEEAGLVGKQIIAMQGPFSEQMNAALIRETNAAVILTKLSGTAGGFSEKIKAAEVCGIKTIVINNPELVNGDDNLYGMDEVLDKLSEKLKVSLLRPNKNKKISAVGIGPGDDKYLTLEAERALSEADVIFGAESVLSRLGHTKVPLINQYQGEKIFEFLEKHHEYKKPVIVFSGDVSLFSGAGKAAAFLTEKGYTVNSICGISSVTLFAQRLNLDISKVRIVSAHGRKCNVAEISRKMPKLMVLTSGMEQAAEICRELPGCNIVIGYELGTASERLINVGKEEFPVSQKGKCLMYIENPCAEQTPVIDSLRDEAFERDEGPKRTPMTKEEIRALVIRKLGITPRAIFYDIGAGTGSVSVETALVSPDIEVYAIEKKPEAIRVLRKNIDKFNTQNVEIVEGVAPIAFEDLPAPTHAFIGGSSGNLREIIHALYTKNSEVKIVLTCVTLETLSEITSFTGDDLGVDAEIIQVGITNYKKAGSYHLSTAQNPVFIVTLLREPPECRKRRNE